LALKDEKTRAGRRFAAPRRTDLADASARPHACSRHHGQLTPRRPDRQADPGKGILPGTYPWLLTAGRRLD